MKGEVGGGWPDRAAHRCISGQVGFTKEYPSDLGTKPLKLPVPRNPLDNLIPPGECIHPSEVLFFWLLLTVPRANGSPPARERIPATAANYTTAVATPDP